MKFYLVGGAVRDQLLGLPVKDKDWVVVGAKPEQLTARGYKQVGKDFPVFLHPDTHEEYALARTERKTQPGYHGFNIYAGTDVTLEEDLQRRDLTINAMALDEQQQLVDPYGGRQDLEQRRLRHISPAFAEDPVRILRIARFAARYQSLGFRVAPTTQTLMQSMVAAGEVDALVAERVWTETLKALAEPNPEVFIQVLRDCGALGRIFPELDNLFGVPQPVRHHPEIDTGLHTLLGLHLAASETNDTMIRFAVLVHDLGKGVTEPADWPQHKGHEEAGVALVESLCERLRCPKQYRELAVHVARYHLHCHRVLELRPNTILKLLLSLDSFRRPERLQQFLLACEFDARGRLGLTKHSYPQGVWLYTAYEAANSIDIKALVAKGLQGQALAQAIHCERITAIKACCRSSL